MVSAKFITNTDVLKLVISSVNIDISTLVDNMTKKKLSYTYIHLFIYLILFS